MGKKMEPGSDNEPDINREMKKSVIMHIFETTRGYHEAGPCT